MNAQCEQRGKYEKRKERRIGSAGNRYLPKKNNEQKRRINKYIIGSVICPVYAAAAYGSAAEHVLDPQRL